ncbi:hypothetical protein [Nocardioides sp.]|uniref:hypothetical protein n=1 Tax=Nocardioides sp. TaxID=35761 RepID=UPI001A2DA80D|nr:hypothetical protein [Nocardioides sp.]MBJ7357137.1 hypothetical protein [Nocardioides sp.]
MAMLLRTAVVLSALVVAGCGEDPGPSSADDPSTAETEAADRQAPFVEKDGEIQVSCGGGDGWSPSIMASGIESPLSQSEMTQVFRELLANPKYAGELELSFLTKGAEGTPWRLLEIDGDAYTLGLDTWTEDGPVDGAFVMGIERRGDAWVWSGGGNCHLAPVLRPGHTWVELHGADLDRTATDPRVDVNERTCTSARDPSPYLHDPYVVETDESVTVYWTSTPPQGGQDCPGNPSVSRPLPLSEPLGDRELLDGSTYPPSPVG